MISLKDFEKTWLCQVCKWNCAPFSSLYISASNDETPYLYFIFESKYWAVERRFVFPAHSNGRDIRHGRGFCGWWRKGITKFYFFVPCYPTVEAVLKMLIPLRNVSHGHDFMHRDPVVLPVDLDKDYVQTLQEYF